MKTRLLRASFFRIRGDAGGKTYEHECGSALAESPARELAKAS